MTTSSYPSDLSEEQWSLIEPLIPTFRTGRPRTTSMRAVVNAILYVVRTGCQWAYLPHDFPPKSTVFEYYSAWHKNGVLDRIHDALRERVRHQMLPGRPRRTAALDSQSVDTSSGGAERGRDNAKKVNGRKRHILVDSLGLLLAVVVTAADVDDAKAAELILPALSEPPCGNIRRVFVDNKYRNHRLALWTAQQNRYRLEPVLRPKEAVGWIRLPKRWVVERTFGWFMHSRRLSVDREKTPASSRAMVQWSMVNLMLNRLNPSKNQPEFQYRQAA